MTPLPTAIRRALVAALSDLDLPAQAIPGPTEYAERGMDRLGFHVTVLAGPPDDEDACERLDELLAADGVKARLEADRTLGGLVADVAVAKCSGYQTHARPEGPCLGATWTVVCLT